MEIKRFGDQFIIDLNGKRIELYWDRKLDFGENLIRRVCERIKNSELDMLVDTIKIVNKNIAEKTKPSKEQIDQLYKTLACVCRIIHIQTEVFFTNMPTRKFEDFVNACYPYMFKTSLPMINKVYNERYNGCECDLERKLNDADTLSDWITTRQLVAKFLANEFTELFKLSISSIGGQAIKELFTVHQPLIFNAGTFFIQLFRTNPCLGDFDKRNMSDDIKRDFIKKIKGIHSEICGYAPLKNANIQKELIGLNENETNDAVISDYIDSLWVTIRKDIELLNDTEEINRVGQLVSLLETFVKAIPRTTILGPKAAYTKTNEERRNIVLGILREWDANVPDDIAALKKMQQLQLDIEKQKKDLIDKSDKEYVGKTQDEINAEKENSGIVLEVKDENGSVVSESQII